LLQHLHFFGKMQLKPWHVRVCAIPLFVVLVLALAALATQATPQNAQETLVRFILCTSVTVHTMHVFYMAVFWCYVRFGSRAHKKSRIGLGLLSMLAACLTIVTSANMRNTPIENAQLAGVTAAAAASPLYQFLVLCLELMVPETDTYVRHSDVIYDPFPATSTATPDATVL